MAVDVYKPCPCGSGKKLKFCCHGIADEMDRVARLMQNNQTRMALQALEAIERSHPENSWAVTTHASILINEGRWNEAREMLRGLLESHPKNDFALGLFATALLYTEGYDQARKAISRAFHRCARSFPGMVSNLADAVAAVLANRGHLLAAREHLALAVRTAAPEKRQQLFEQMVGFESNRQVPYLLRSVHHLPHYTGPHETEAAKAAKYAAVGRWDRAAELFAQLGEEEPDNPALWHSAGLCRAWDADETGAAEALHLAATLYEDFGSAVECEALAQVLDLRHAEDAVKLQERDYAVASAARLLSRLDQNERFARLPVPDSERDWIGAFELLDSPCPADIADLPYESLPEVLGIISIQDADIETGAPAEARMSALGDRRFAQAASLLNDVMGDELTPASGEPEVYDAVPPELCPLDERRHRAPSLSYEVQGRFERERRELNVARWLRTPHSTLGGKTPLEAAGDPAARVAATAAVYVGDAHCLQCGYPLDSEAVFAELGLEPLPPIDVRDDLPLHQFSAMQLHRLPPAELSDEQLTYTLNRASLIHHDRFLASVLREVLRRPGCADPADRQRVLGMLIDICRDQFRLDEALDYAAQARDAGPVDESAFEHEMKWDLRELALRLNQPEDPRTDALVERFRNYYIPKVPELGEYVEYLLQSAGYASPAVATPSAGQGEGTWTPSAVREAGPSKKLWLPGQS